MTDVEQRLRDMLARNADDAPPAGQLLHRVRAKAHRRRRWHRAGVAGGVALASATAAAVLVVTLTGGGSPTVGGGGPDFGGQLVHLVPGKVSTVVFPFTPRKPLPGPGEPVVMLVGGEPTLQYDGVTVTLLGQGQPASDRPGEISPDDAILPVGSGKSVLIHSATPIDRGILDQYVSAFEDNPLTAPAPYTFDLVPEGFTVDNMTPAAVTFAPPGVSVGPGFKDKIAVLLDSESTQPEGTQVTDEGTILHRRLGDGRTLTVQVPADVPLAGADLERFAAGVHPTVSAQAGVG